MMRPRPVRRGTAAGSHRRAALAGSAAAAVWALQEPVDQRVFACHYSDVAVLGKAVTRGRAWWPAGFAIHLLNGALFGLAYEAVRRRRPQQPLGLAVAMAVLGRSYPTIGRHRAVSDRIGLAMRGAKTPANRRRERHAGSIPAASIIL
jgi:hypothetical protein